MKIKEDSLTIKGWNEADRPREKMVLHGKRSLTDAELLAVLLGSGNRNETAVALSKRILATYGNNLLELEKCSLEELTQFRGVGIAKAVTILTGLELGRRTRIQEALKKQVVSSSKDVFEFMQPLIGNLQHEEFWVLYLNNANKILFKQQLSKGGLTGTVVDVRLVLKKALELLAVGVIMCHNHPSGTLMPSHADKQLTNKLKKGAETLDIKILDHLIITEKAYFSFADSGEL